MLVAIERNRFTLLFKYDEVTVGLNSIFDVEIEELLLRLSDPFEKNFALEKLNDILPLFELDHEVLLLEVNKASIVVDRGVTIYFNSVQGIYPLTEEGERLLTGKLNDNIELKQPLLSEAIQKVKAHRSIRSRTAASNRLLEIFGVRGYSNSEFVGTLTTAIKSILNVKEKGKGIFLYHLLTYDTTPSYIPSGNVEFIAKIGAITLLQLGRGEDTLKGSTFYKKCVQYKSEINRGGWVEGLENFRHLLRDEELRSSFDNINKNIGLEVLELDLFAIAYYFLAIKSHLIKHEGNILPIADDLMNAARKNPVAFAQVLLLIGYSFSFEGLYESIHALEQAPILKKTKVVDPMTNLPIIEIPIKNEENSGPSSAIVRNQKDNPTTKEELVSSPQILVQGFVESPQTKIEDDLLPPKLETKVTKPTVPRGKPKGKEYQNLVNADPELPLVDPPIIAGTISRKPSDGINSILVSDFYDWIQNSELSKPKKKAWDQFVKFHFSDFKSIMNLDELLTKLDGSPELEEKLLSKTGKQKFDMDGIRRFFRQ